MTTTKLKSPTTGDYQPTDSFLMLSIKKNNQIKGKLVYEKVYRRVLKGV